jgi:hypothetical protein
MQRSRTLAGGSDPSFPESARARIPTRAVRIPDRPLSVVAKRWRTLVRGILIAAAGPAAVTAVVVRVDLSRPFQVAALLYLLPITAATFFAGMWAGLLSAAASFVGLLYYFAEPMRSFRWPHATEDIVGLTVFVAVSYILARSISAEHGTRVSSEAAERHVSFLAAANEIIARSALDLTKTLSELANVTIPAIADICIVDLVDPDRTITTMAVASGEPVRAALADNLHHMPPIQPSSPNAVAEVIRSGKAVLYETVDEDVLRGLARTPDHMALLLGFHLRALMIVPLPSRGGILGTITLGSVRPRRRYGQEELSLAGDLAVRAATALENVRLYEERDRSAQALQESLLPTRMPEIPAVEIAYRFHPFTEADLIGGDFFDVFQTGARSWAFVVGDVCGKGSEAAALTGLARNTIRAAAMSRAEPSSILGVLNQAIIRHDIDRYCTAAYARLDLIADGDDLRARLVVSSGGHPAPIVLRRSGVAEEIGRSGTLLGVFPDAEQTDTEIDLSLGDAVVLYTDGLLDERQATPELKLLSILTECGGADAEAIAERLDATASRADVVFDDRAVLVFRLSGETEPEETPRLWRST